MTVQSAQSVTVLFTTRVFATGVGTNADSLPTGTLFLNGTANGATVTVTNISTGLYKAAVTMPTLAIADRVDLEIAATVSTIADTAVIWRDTKDIAVDANGVADANAKLWLGGTIPAVNVTGVPKVDMVDILGTAVSSPATAGILDVNVKNMNNVAATAITTIKAVQGLTTADTIATYTGNTKQTADVAALITTVGTAGVGLTNLGDTRIANLDATVSSRLATSGYTVPPTANANADALLDRSAGVETGLTFRQAMRLISAILFGKVSGAATATNTFRDTNDSKDRVVSTVTADGDRTSVTLDAS